MPVAFHPGSLLAPWALAVELVALLAPAYALARVVVRRARFDAAATPVVAYAIAAVAGYAAFWCYLAKPELGRAVSVVWIVSAIFAVRAIWRRGVVRAEVVPLALTFAAGLFYLGALGVAGGTLDAAHRFFVQRPGDNVLPQTFAELLYQGADPRHRFGDWLSSDRPPLQAGMLLLVRPLFWIARLRDARGYEVGGILAQLAWIPATWLLCARARFTAGTRAYVLALTIFSGFALYNTDYTWPKLLAAAFCFAALTFALPEPGTDRFASFLLAGACAALALLAHSGAVLFLLPALVVLLGTRRLPFSRGLAAGCAAAAVLLLPWAGYQHFYDPPGDRLLKMHLGRDFAIDSRPATAAIAEAYAHTPLGAVIANKIANVRTAVGGTPELGSAIIDEPDEALDRWRVREREGVTAALGVVNVGWLALIWWWLRPPPAAPAAAMRRTAAALLGLTAATTAFWCLVMFGPNATVTTNEAYAAELALFVALGAALAQLPRTARLALFALACADLVVTWIAGSLGDASRRWPSVDPFMVLLAFGGAAGTLALLRYAARAGDAPGAPVASNASAP